MVFALLRQELQNVDLITQPISHFTFAPGKRCRRKRKRSNLVPVDGVINGTLEFVGRGIHNVQSLANVFAALFTVVLETRATRWARFVSTKGFKNGLTWWGPGQHMRASTSTLAPCLSRTSTASSYLRDKLSWKIHSDKDLTRPPPLTPWDTQCAAAENRRRD